MDNVTDFPKPADRAAALFGAKRHGHTVVVDGHEIPGLTIHDRGDEIELVVDGRFSIDIPRDRACQVAWLVAQAMAVARGYPHLGAETKDRPFAPQVMTLSEEPTP